MSCTDCTGCTELPKAFDFNVPQPVSVDVALYGGVFAKRHTIPMAGTFVPQHSHGYDHLSLVTSGGLRAWCDDVLVGDFIAPASIKIAAGTKHTFQALADGTTFFCLHNVDTFEQHDDHELPGRSATVSASRDDGIVFAQEAIDDFLASDSPLFYAHCQSVGEAPDAWKDKNWALMKRMEAQRALYITTARQGGELLGYLMVIVSPALDELGTSEAIHTLFYTSPDVAGLGLRLHAASLDLLRSMGVETAVFRAGHRGKGPKLGSLYRRLGATPSGNLFMLRLKD